MIGPSWMMRTSLTLPSRSPSADITVYSRRSLRRTAAVPWDVADDVGEHPPLHVVGGQVVDVDGELDRRADLAGEMDRDVRALERLVMGWRVVHAAVGLLEPAAEPAAADAIG